MLFCKLSPSQISENTHAFYSFYYELFYEKLQFARIFAVKLWSAFSWYNTHSPNCDV